MAGNLADKHSAREEELISKVSYTVWFVDGLKTCTLSPPLLHFMARSTTLRYSVGYFNLTAIIHEYEQCKHCIKKCIKAAYLYMNIK